ncbi:MFS transporter [Streptomyces sp. NPDC059070]|uniref:MFS transporter n=1 Tax=Streptomyces sp. NPDC059070 TaxID=3346713 RepID=UPI0036814A78
MTARAVLRPYAALRTVPGGPGLLSAGLIARLAPAMNPLALLFLFKEHTGHYTFGATACAVYALAGAAAGPPLGRLCDRRRPAPVLYAACAVHLPALLSLLTAIAYGAPRPVLLVLLLAAGAAAPPVTGVVRAAWYLRTDTRSGRAALRPYALAAETVCAEAVFVLGPLLVATALAVADATAALVLGCLCCVAGTCALARNTAAMPGPSRQPTSQTRRLGPLRLSGFATVLWCTALVSLSFGISDVALPAAALQHTGAHSTSAAGLLLALWATSSLASGLVFGADRRPGRRLRRPGRLMVLLALCLAALSAAPGLVALAVGSMLCGLLTGPVLITLNALVADIAPADVISEAYVWASSVTVVVCALGTALTGPVVDRPYGTTWSFLAAGLSTAGAAAIAGRGSRSSRYATHAVGSGAAPVPP